MPTLCMASALDIIEAGRPPRAVFLDYPLGHTAGRPFDRKNQRAVLRDALTAFESIREPGAVVQLEHRWAESDAWKTADAEPGGDDTRAPRGTEPVYQTGADRLAAEVNAAKPRS